MKSSCIIRTLVFALCMLPNIALFSSPFNNSDTTSTIANARYPRFQWTFNLQPVSYNALHIKYFGEPFVHSNRTFSGVVGTGINVKVYKSWSVGAGWDATIIPYNVNFDFEAELTNPAVKTNQHDFNTSDYFVPTAGLYLAASKRFDAKSRYGYSPIITAGIKYNITPIYSSSTGSGYFIDTSQPNVRLFDFELNNETEGSNGFRFTSYFVKVGIWIMSKKLNTLQLNFVMNYSPTIVAKGSYYFSNLPKQNLGKVELGANYVGLDVSYGFELMRKRARQALDAKRL